MRRKEKTDFKDDVWSFRIAEETIKGPTMGSSFLFSTLDGSPLPGAIADLLHIHLFSNS